MNQLLVTAISGILSVTTVVLIMQGNKRAYYYDKALAAKDLEIEKQKAEAANEAKSGFLSTMSHEITWRGERTFLHTHFKKMKKHSYMSIMF